MSARKRLCLLFVAHDVCAMHLSHGRWSHRRIVVGSCCPRVSPPHFMRHASSDIAPTPRPTPKPLESRCVVYTAVSLLPLPLHLSLSSHFALIAHCCPHFLREFVVDYRRITTMRRLLAVLVNNNRLLAVIPLLPPFALLLSVLCQQQPPQQSPQSHSYSSLPYDSYYSQQLLAYVCVALVGFSLTHQLIPHIQQYTLQRGICGKDLGKQGSPLFADQPM